MSGTTTEFCDKSNVPVEECVGCRASRRIEAAWNLIGYDGTAESVALDGLPARARVRILGGRALYEGVSYDSARARSERVRLFRLVTESGLREVSRWVDPDELLELVEEER